MDMGRTKIIQAEPHSQQSGTHEALGSASHTTPSGCLPISTHLPVLRRELWRPKPHLRRPKIASSSLSLPSLTNPIPTKLHLPLTSLPSLPSDDGGDVPHRQPRDITVAVAAPPATSAISWSGYWSSAASMWWPRPAAATPAPTPSPSSPAPHSLSRLDRPASLAAALPPSVDVIVSCLASRSGGVRDSFLVDYQATANSHAAGRARGADKFVLLSAFCVQKPLLAFQRAKLKLESELAVTATDPSFTYSIVRPTAFFKSLGGQVELVKSGEPYVVFGDSRLCAFKPISEPDLASLIADCVLDTDNINRIPPIGGSGSALTPLEQGAMLFRLLGKEPKFVKVPIGVMDWVTRLVPAAEFGRIGRCYAAESLLVWDQATVKEEFMERVISEGTAGQDLGEQTIF